MCPRRYRFDPAHRRNGRGTADRGFPSSMRHHCRRVDRENRAPEHDDQLRERLLRLLQESLRVEVPLSEFLKTPTVAGLSRLVLGYEPARGVVDRIAAILNRVEDMSEDDLKKTIEAKERQAGSHGKEKHIAGWN